MDIRIYNIRKDSYLLKFKKRQGIMINFVSQGTGEIYLCTKG